MSGAKDSRAMREKEKSPWWNSLIPVYVVLGLLAGSGFAYVDPHTPFVAGALVGAIVFPIILTFIMEASDNEQ